MKLDLRENMYIRTNYGRIDKIFNIKDDYVIGVSPIDNFYVYYIDNIVKASYNIIDILEKGDYVNGLPIQKINTYLFTNEKYLNLFGSCSDWENEDIKSVVTKEQMEQMAYKVGD